MADPWALIGPGEHGRPLIEEHTVADLLGAGWALAFDGVLARQCWASRAEEWLGCATESDRCRSVLLEVLVRGGASGAGVLADLYAMAGQTEYHDAIGQLLLRKITRAYGVELA